MSDYIVPPIETDPDTLAAEALDYLETKIPGFSATPPSPEGYLVEANARLAAENRDLASDVTTAIFRRFGQLVGVRPIEAVAATALSTWTMIDDAGYTIPAGTAVGIAAAGDELITFLVQDDVVVAAGDTVTGAGAVALVAQEPGANGSGLAGVPQLVDALAFVQSIALVGPTSGGADAEDDDHYLGRLRDDLALQAPRPILPRDFAVMARNIAGVERALAIDGYNPDDDSTGNERMVAVAVADALGAAVAPGVKATVDDMLQAQRELNFVVNVIDPTYTEVDITFTAVAFAGFDPVDVEARAAAAAAAFLDPALWGLPTFGDPSSGGGWISEDHVRYLEVAAALNAVEGLDYISALTIGLHGGAMGAADVALDGAAPLPEPGTIAATVDAP